MGVDVAAHLQPSCELTCTIGAELPSALLGAIAWASGSLFFIARHLSVEGAAFARNIEQTFASQSRSHLYPNERGIIMPASGASQTWRTFLHELAARLGRGLLRGAKGPRRNVGSSSGRHPFGDTRARHVCASRGLKTGQHELTVFGDSDTVPVLCTVRRVARLTPRDWRVG